MNESIISLAIHITLNALPFIVFGFFIYKKLKKSALLFVAYGISLALTRIAVENKDLFIQQMRATGISRSEALEAVMSWQIQLPMVLAGISILLLIVALTSLAVGINRLCKTNANASPAI
jgi:hypothetical protein